MSKQSKVTYLKQKKFISSQDSSPGTEEFIFVVKVIVILMTSKNITFNSGDKLLMPLCFRHIYKVTKSLWITSVNSVLCHPLWLLLKCYCCYLLWHLFSIRSVLVSVFDTNCGCVCRLLHCYCYQICYQWYLQDSNKCSKNVVKLSVNFLLEFFIWKTGI